MTSFPKPVFALFLLTAVLALCSCANPQAITYGTQPRTIDMGHYVVDPPARGIWSVFENRNQQSVMFVKPPSAGSATGPVESTIILVAWNAVTNQSMSSWSAGQVAEDYLNGEVADMKEKGVQTGLYELHDIQKGESSVNGNNLYTLSYKQRGGKWFPSNLYANAILYLYFPATYEKTRRFYAFHYQEFIKSGQQEFADLASLHAVIRSFATK